MSTAIATLSSKLAQRFGIDDDAELATTLKQTAFKSKEPVSDAQLAALLVVANEYGLNPFTKEIYAYPDQYKGIVPVVGVDGWIRIINEHPMFDGLEFDAATTEVTCRIFRKDRTRPTVLTEYLEECRRPTDPWKNMPRRMLRHKALIQCARVAFGFAFYDEDEGPVAAGAGPEIIDNETGEVIQAARGPRRKSETAPTPEPAIVNAVEPPPAAATSTPRPAAPAAAAPAGAGISGGQVAYLRNKLKAAGVEEASICDRFQATSIELLSGAQFDEIKLELLSVA